MSDPFDSAQRDTSPPESSAGDVTLASARTSARGLDHPTRIGRYEIVSILGEGGMGVVYKAHQTHPVRRTVALKLIKLGLDTRQIVARFDAERQALAMIDHPNVARVFDAGADDLGRPYFVMEFVPGEAITTYCDNRKLTTRQRLDLFSQACGAVQHAHQKGIIHRDLKPGNLLVHELDGQPAVKVIDFGVAKAMTDRPSDRALATERGQLLGTPEYMSPEQAENGSIEVDTRTDVYSLGVILYELMTGVLPFDSSKLRSGTYADIQRAIRETQPIAPSTRLKRDASHAEFAAKVRATEPATLLRTLRSDLDWVVMKALEKEPDRRYAGASELAADVQRYLRHEPVIAGPPTATYRARKFIRRNRVAVAAGSAVALALVLGIIGITWQAIRAMRAEREAKVSLASETAVADFLTQSLESVNPEQAQGREISVREMLDAAAARLGEDLANQPRVEAKLRHTIGKTYHALGQPDLAMPHLQRALELSTREFGEDSDTALMALDQIGQILVQRGRFSEAEPLLRRQVELSTRRLGADHETTLYAMNTLAVCLQSQERLSEAEPIYRTVVDGLRKKLGPEHADVITMHSNLAFLIAQLGRRDEAIPMLRDSLAVHRKVLGDDHPRTIMAQSNLALLLQHVGQLDDAIALYREVLAQQQRINGNDHPATNLAMANLGETLRRKAGASDRSEAESLLRAAWLGQRAKLGDASPVALESMHNLSLVLLDQNRVAEAQDLTRQGYDIARHKLPPTSVLGVRVRHRYVDILMKSGRFAESEPIARENVELAGSPGTELEFAL